MNNEYMVKTSDYTKLEKELINLKALEAQHRQINGELREENKKLQDRIDSRDFLLKSQGTELKELYEENKQLRKRLHCAREYVITHNFAGYVKMMNVRYLLPILGEFDCDEEGDSNE